MCEHNYFMIITSETTVITETTTTRTVDYELRCQKCGDKTK